MRGFLRNTKLAGLAAGGALALATVMCLTWSEAVASKRARKTSPLLTEQYRRYSESRIKEVLQRPLTLESCIGIALSKNYALKVVEAKLTETEATLSGTHAQFLPVFNLDATRGSSVQERPIDANNPQDPTQLNFDRNVLVASLAQTLPTGASIQLSGDLRRDIDSPDAFGAAPTSTRNRAYAISFTQPLLRGAWPAVARGAISLAAHDRNLQETELLDTQLETVFLLKEAYYQVLQQRELVRVNQAAIKRDSTLVLASKSKVIAKVATRRDVLSAEIQLADDLSTLIKSETDYELALDALKEVMGLAFEMEITLAQSSLVFESVALDEEALIHGAFRINPAIQGGEIGVERSRLELKLAKNELLPQIDISASFTGAFDTNTDTQTDLRTTGWEAALKFNYPIFNRAASAKKQGSQALLSQNRHILTNLQRQTKLSIRSIVRTVYSISQELKALQRTKDAAQQKVEFSSTMFNLGRASNLDVTDSQESLLKAQTKYIGKLVEYHTQLALLERLTGEKTTNL